MPDWQGELESLLATLNVSLETPATSSELLAETDTSVPAPLSPTNGARQLDPVVPVEPADDTTESLVEVVPADGEEISAVRSEIEATLREVLTMARTGRMDRALRDDVVFVLEALTRPRPTRGPRTRGLRSPMPEGPDDSGTEWNLASAAAVLRFCRIVLRLTTTLARGDEL